MESIFGFYQETISEKAALELLLEAENVYDLPLQEYCNRSDSPLFNKRIEIVVDINSFAASKNYPIEEALDINEGHLAVRLFQKGYGFLDVSGVDIWGNRKPPFESIWRYFQSTKDNAKLCNELAGCAWEQYKSYDKVKRTQIFHENMGMLRTILSFTPDKNQKEKYKVLLDFVYDILNDLDGYEIDLLGNKKAYEFFEEKTSTEALKKQCIESFEEKRFLWELDGFTAEIHLRRYLKWLELGMLDNKLFWDLFHLNILLWMDAHGEIKDSEVWNTIDTLIFKKQGGLQKVYDRYWSEKNDLTYALNCYIDNWFDDAILLDGNSKYTIIVKWLRAMKNRKIYAGIKYDELNYIQDWKFHGNREDTIRFLELLMRYSTVVQIKESKRLTIFDKAVIELGAVDLIETALQKNIWCRSKLDVAIKYTKKMEINNILPFLIVMKNSSKICGNVV